MHKRSLRARVLAGTFIATVLLIALGSSAAFAASSNTSFGFHASNIQGFPPGAIALTGGGTFNASTGSAHLGGGFSCTASVTQGPLTGCQAGEGVRWDTASLLPGTLFKCTGTESLRPATTSDDTVVLHADFYRAGDGNDESFNANMIVTTQDLDAAIPGVQNVWVQGIGCGTAHGNLSS
jgi:hypothetical protein